MGIKVVKIRLENFMGFEELEITPGGGMTTVTGENGLGKTSIAEAIKTIAKGGVHEAKLLRTGADKGQVVLLFDDGTKAIKKITQDKSAIELSDENGKLGSPASRIKKMFDSVGANPIELLTCSDSDRVKKLLEAINLKADKARLFELSGVQVLSDDALLGIEEARDAIYKSRTAVNAEAKAARANALVSKQDAQALPKEPAKVEVLQSSLEQIDLCRSEREKEIRSKYAHESSASNQRISEIDSQMKELEFQKRTLNQKLMELQGQMDLELIESSNKASAQAAPIKQEIANASQLNASVKLRESLLDRAEKQTEEAEAKEAHSKALTAKIEALDAYKKELLASLPIKGVSVESGEIAVDGKPFSIMNEAERVKFAMRVAMLRSGDFKVICMDGAETLDSKNLDLMKAEIEANGFQAFVTRVSDGPLKIT